MTIEEIYKIGNLQFSMRLFNKPKYSLIIEFVLKTNQKELDEFVNTLNISLLKNDLGISDIYEIDENNSTGNVFIKLNKDSNEEKTIQKILEVAKKYTFLKAFFIVKIIKNKNYYTWNYIRIGDEKLLQNFVDKDEIEIPVSEEFLAQFTHERTSGTQLFMIVFILIFILTVLFELVIGNK
jgi:hypothetical protein